MKCAAALSTETSTEAAVEECFDKLEKRLGRAGADLAAVFCSSHHAESLKVVSERLRGKMGVGHVIGCTGESIIGEGREIEESPALSVWAGKIDGVELRAIRLDGPPDLDQVRDSDLDGSLLLLGDPFTFPADEWFKAWDEARKSLRVHGGMASASREPGGNRLVLDDRTYSDGAVALEIKGSARIRSAVSQGCRPIGGNYVITKADRNIILEVGRRPTVDVFREVFAELSDEDRIKVRAGLHIGRVINEYQDKFEAGDFLIRNVVGATESGGIGITDLVRVGQTVRFHVRDADTADEDLRQMLRHSDDSSRPAGALVFSCNGRGTRLFDVGNHDASVLRDELGGVPAAGFFAMGEFGPVGGRNFVHGYTASVIIFEES